MTTDITNNMPEETQKDTIPGEPVPVNQESQKASQTITYYDRIIKQIPREDTTPPAYPYNDTGNAQRFLDICREFVRYCPEEKRWYIFNQVKWAPDTVNMAPRLARIAMELSYQKEADYLKETGNYQQMQQHYKNSARAGNLSAIQNCLGLAAMNAAISPNQFDNDPYWFHAQNGALNMKTWEGILYHEKRQYFTKTAGAGFQLPDAESSVIHEPSCPGWIQFVQQCCMGDDALCRYLQKAAGYSIMTGDISEQKVFCLLGAGRNGKSLFINILAEVAGDYANKLESSVLCVNRFGDRDADTSKELFRIRGSRFVYSNEFGRNSTLNESFIKAITDGGRLSCRPLYGSSIEYTPTYTLWFSTNHMPNLQAMDEGIRRRIVVIPFRNSLTEQQIDRHLADKLRQETDGILHWLMQGYFRYTLEGLNPPEAVRNATACYFAEQDSFQLFVNEHYTIQPDGKVYAKEVYKDYVAWCSENGEKPLSNIKLGKELQRLGIEKSRDTTGIYFELMRKNDAVM